MLVPVSLGARTSYCMAHSSRTWGGWGTSSRGGSFPSILHLWLMPKPAASSDAFTDLILHLSKVTKKKKKIQSALVFEITFLLSSLIRKAVTALDSTLEQNKKA